MPPKMKPKHALPQSNVGRSVDYADAYLGLSPPTAPWETFSTRNSELVIGIVGPLGVDTGKILDLLTRRLSAFGYRSIEIRLSRTVIPALAARTPSGTAFEQATQLINLGNKIRKEAVNNGVLAVAAAAEISGQRPQDGQKIAYVISSLKRKEEVAVLRRIYGNGFYLFAVHTERDRRVETLMGRDRSMHRWQAEKLVSRDEHESLDHGQDTSNTFHLADFFVADEGNDDKLENSIGRCLDLIFANPNLTPTFNEFAMFMAFASSVRSADLSRQVGTVIARNNEILTTGANDCPAAGGGLYWPEFLGNRIDDVARGRDYKRGCDSNIMERKEIIKAIMSSVVEKGIENSCCLEPILERSLKHITEYGRMVHAEMEALLACARSQVSVVGATLYCTTFPCHNCAKHIVAAGIREVIYVEPYSKSKALKFHDDAIATNKVESGEKKVRFKPFIGVGPRLFFDLFSLSLSQGRPIDRKDDQTGSAIKWTREQAQPRVQMLPFAPRRFEEAALKYIKTLIKKRGTK